MRVSLAFLLVVILAYIAVATPHEGHTHDSNSTDSNNSTNNSTKKSAAEGVAAPHTVLTGVCVLAVSMMSYAALH